MISIKRTRRKIALKSMYNEVKVPRSKNERITAEMTKRAVQKSFKKTFNLRRPKSTIIISITKYNKINTSTLNLRYI